MWYKQHPDGTWSYANKVFIPNNPSAPIILEFNHNAKVQGWEWFDNPPQGYLDWLTSLENPDVLVDVPLEPIEGLRTSAKSASSPKSISSSSEKSISLLGRVKRFFVKLIK